MTDKIKVILSGKCPFQNVDNYSIEIDKVDCTAMDETVHSYMYGNFECEYAKLNRLECYNSDDCPILSQNGINRNDKFN